MTNQRQESIYEHLKAKYIQTNSLSKYAIEQMATYNSSGSDNPICNKCRDRGDFLNIEKVNGVEYEVIVPCDCQKNKLKERNLKMSELAQKAKNSTFDNYYSNHSWQRKIKEKAKANIETMEWFYIGGQTGSGKTHICLALCHEIAKKKRVDYMQWTSEILEMKSLYFNHEELSKKLTKFKMANVLYIDDLFKKTGDGSISKQDIEVAFNIINYRYNNFLKTIISSENSLDELLKIDDATSGRIKERARDFVINIDVSKDKNIRMG